MAVKLKQTKMKKLIMVLAATLICGACLFTSCKKEDNSVIPATKTVLVSMEITNMFNIGHFIEEYTYDADYRLVNKKIVQVSNGAVVSDLDYIYTSGHITKRGTENDCYITDECTLDELGRIVECHHKSVRIETGNLVFDELYTFTYDENGHLAIKHQGDIVQTFNWEGDELRNTSMVQGNCNIVEVYETCDAPAQALFARFGYEQPELCLQGCFGVLPAHMFSKNTVILYLGDNVASEHSYDYSYTTVDGRLATIDDGNGQYILHWGQR
jgi:hypothetical protein